MTVHTDLLTSFCECYDLKQHTTNIFQDIVNSLGAYVHSLFINPQIIGQPGSGKASKSQTNTIYKLAKHNFFFFSKELAFRQLKAELQHC